MSLDPVNEVDVVEESDNDITLSRNIEAYLL